MTRESKFPRQDGVDFHFLGAEEDTYLTGSVLFRDGQMILDIPEGDGPYLIKGVPHGHWFRGVSSVRGKSNHIEAKWVDVDGTYVGIWIEDGYEYLFSFQLPHA